MTNVGFVCIEGNEGTGKTTLIQNLFHHFSSRGVTVIIVKSPGYSPVGDMVRRELLSQTGRLTNVSPAVRTMLFLAGIRDTMDVLEQNLCALIKQGVEDIAVLLDRWTITTSVLQGCLEGQTGLVSRLIQDMMSDPTLDTYLSRSQDVRKTVVGLTATYATAKQRLVQRGEFLNKYDAMSETEYNKTTDAYVSYVPADSVVSTDHKSPEEINSDVLQILREKGYPTKWID